MRASDAEGTTDPACAEITQHHVVDEGYPQTHRQITSRQRETRESCQMPRRSHDVCRQRRSLFKHDLYSIFPPLNCLLHVNGVPSLVTNNKLGSCMQHLYCVEMYQW